MTALKFVFYINSDLLIPAKKLQTPRLAALCKLGSTHHGKRMAGNVTSYFKHLILILILLPSLFG